MRTVILLLILSLPLLLWADATPKFYAYTQFVFYLDGEQVEELDKLLILAAPERNGELDSIYCEEDRNDFDQNMIHLGGFKYNGYTLTIRDDIDELQFFVVHDGTEYQSEMMDFSGERSIMKLELKNGEIVDVSPLFYIDWIDYLVALLITLGLELLYLFWFCRKRKVAFKAVYLVLILVNLCSHSLLWYIDTNFDVNIVLLELGVIVFEAFVLYKSLSQVLSLKQSWKISMWANLWSWILGTILFSAFMMDFY